MQELLARIEEKKKKFDAYKPLPKALEKNLGDWFRMALTYTSNAIEGNTLSFAETALVVQEGITIGGKSLTEHQEAINSATAISYVQSLAANKTRKDLALTDILAIHEHILKKIDDEHAGVFRTVAVRIMGSQVPRPNYLKVPQLMDEFMKWMTTSTDNIVRIAADAHLKFVFIHPFIDGNGRTARLIFNLLLLQDGYPLVVIEKEKRLAYVNAIEKALLNNDTQDYYSLMFHAVEQSLDSYLKAIDESEMKGIS